MFHDGFSFLLLKVNHVNADCMPCSELRSTLTVHVGFL